MTENGAVVTFAFDNAGECVAEKTEINGHVGVVIYKPNAIIGESEPHEKSLVTVKFDRKYDRHGNILKENILRDGEIIQATEYEYDAKNKVTRTIIDGEIMTDTTYFQNGEVDKIRMFHKDEPLTYFCHDCKCFKNVLPAKKGFANAIVYEENQGYVIAIKSGDIKISYTYDEWGAVKSILYNDAVYVAFNDNMAIFANGKSVNLQPAETNGDVIQSVITKDIVTKTTDGLGRLKNQQTPITDESFGYLQRIGHATALVDLHSYKIKNFCDPRKTSYKYDNSGNIIEIRGTYGAVMARYGYDGFNRLVRDGETEIQYDADGNITQKGKMKFTYDKNKMLTFGDEKCVYDVLGNPTKYRDAILEWDLRSLVKYGDIDYAYDTNGLRNAKTFGTWETEYVWQNGHLMTETRKHHHTDKIEYVYGDDGIAGFKLKRNNDVQRTFWYLKNMQNDITAIYLETGDRPKLVAEYKYDAWGNHTITNHTADKIGDLNPFRYRGYYYDVDIKKYYLKSRWYDPETCRFLNMDDLAVIEKSRHFVNGLNLYIYANNNPVMYVDENGMFFDWLWKCVVDAVTFVASAVVSIINTGIDIVNTLNSNFSAVVESIVTGKPVYPNEKPPLLPVIPRVENMLGNFQDNFWGIIGGLNDNFKNSLDFLSCISGLGVPLLATYPSLAILTFTVGGVALLITILNYFRPNKE